MRVRLYHRLRTAHLERAAQLPRSTILYAARRYDFDDDLAAQLDLVHVPGWRAAWWLATHDVAVLEVNEPLHRESVRSTALALVGLGVRRVVRWTSRPQVVAYAIENLEPALARPPQTLLARVVRPLDSLLVRSVWARIDRIVFGTEAASSLYSRTLPPREALESTVVPALPAPLIHPADARKEAGSVLFLGAFHARKGIQQLLEAWPHVREVVPDASLLVMGKGALEDVVRSGVAEDPSITMEVDPSRERIREALSRSQVLVLPSQPSSGWREQVGLPIVEGLAHGCTVVSTTETGLADWLAAHGHRVARLGDRASLVAALTLALQSPLDPAEVLASLPGEDGRLSADSWLFAPVASRSGASARGC